MSHGGNVFRNVQKSVTLEKNYIIKSPNLIQSNFVPATLSADNIQVKFGLFK